MSPQLPILVLTGLQITAYTANNCALPAIALTAADYSSPEALSQ